MMSLPYHFGTTLENIPLAAGYLEAEPKFKEKWRLKLARQRVSNEAKKLKIGVVWAGSNEHRLNHFRNIPLTHFARLFEWETEFHCLQKEITESDREAVKNHQNVAVWDNELKDFSDTAGLVAQLDLVISVDTSVAHLSAAMGKPTWILLSHSPDFRWLLDRTDSPWYHCVRLFRQGTEQDWQAVIEQVKQTLT